MVLTKEQLSELICKHSERENGLQDLLEILLESMMVSERREYLRENSTSGLQNAVEWLSFQFAVTGLK